MNDFDFEKILKILHASTPLTDLQRSKLQAIIDSDAAEEAKDTV